MVEIEEGRSWAHGQSLLYRQQVLKDLLPLLSLTDTELWF